jgi:hypothetical protein
MLAFALSILPMAAEAQPVYFFTTITMSAFGVFLVELLENLPEAAIYNVNSSYLLLGI